MNLDPFGKYDDSAIWRALQLAHLRVFVQSLPEALHYECGEGGQNLRFCWFTYFEIATGYIVFYADVIR